MAFQLIVNQLIIGEFGERDVFMPQMVAHPDDQYQSHIRYPEYRKYLQGIFYGQISSPVEPDQQEGGDAEYFPSNEERLEVSGENDDVIADIKEQNRIEKEFIKIL